MVKHLKVDDDAKAIVEIYAKDTGLSEQAAVSQLIKTKVDIATAQNYQQNNNCHWDLYKLNSITGAKDFGCPMKRLYAKYRDSNKPETLNEECCKICPRRSLTKDVFKFERMMGTGDGFKKPENPQPEKAAAIKAEIAKDIAALAPTVAAAKKVSPPEARPQWINNHPKYVKCDNCALSIYNDSDANQVLDDLTAHTKQIHNRDLTNNEINQLKVLNRLILQDGKKEAA